MEDEYFVANGGRFAAIFDGHGGSGVAQYLKRQLYPNVSQFLQQYYWEECDVQEDHELLIPPQQSTPVESSEDLVLSSSYSSTRQLLTRPSRPRIKPSLSCHVSALRAAFEKVEQDVMNDDNLEFQGSTAVAVVVVESEDGHRTLLSANVGDSRAVLSRKGRAVELTHDHKPNDEKEKARIMAMGETIEWDQDCKVHRVRNLSLARAIGDRYAKPAVSPEVEIQHFPVVEDQDEFVIIASDGLWDVMSSQDAVTYVHSQMQRELASLSASSKDNVDNYRVVLRRNMAKFLAREAIRKGSSDNVSVLMVWL
jgi:serine/threonine protein phosphatase PrpC